MKLPTARGSKGQFWQFDIREVWAAPWPHLSRLHRCNVFEATKLLLAMSCSDASGGWGMLACAKKNAESSMDWFNRISAGTDRWSLPFNIGFSCHFCPSSDSWKREETHDSLSHFWRSGSIWIFTFSPGEVRCSVNETHLSVTSSSGMPILEAPCQLWIHHQP